MVGFIYRIRFVRMSELMDAVGKRLGSLIGCEAAMITAGAPIPGADAIVLFSRAALC